MEELGESMVNILMLNPWAMPPMVAGNMRKTIRTKKKTGIILDMFLRLMFEFWLSDLIQPHKKYNIYKVW